MNLLYLLWQCTWGILQSALGLVQFLLTRKCRHFWYHGALVTVWDKPSSVSLGLFVFVTGEPFFYDKLKGCFNRQEMLDRLLVHEYGHTIQSLVLGPAYLLLIGIPSTLWGFLPCFARLRRERQVSYFACFTEKWANAWGERVTGQKSLGQAVID